LIGEYSFTLSKDREKGGKKDGESGKSIPL
jgi:hypothetical protein